MKLPEIGVRRPILTVMLFVAILILGVVSLTMLAVDMMPEIEPPSMSVITPWPGASAEDVETKVTQQIENQLSIINNLDELRSTSKENLSVVTCKFKWGTNLDEAANDIRDRLDFARRNLPDDVEDITIFKFNTSMMPVLLYAVSAEESWERLYDIVDDQISDPLKRLPGVGAVQIMGGLRRQIDIRLDRSKLAGYGLTLQDIANALRAENLTLPAGTIKIGTIEYTIRVPGEYQTPDQIKDIVVKRANDAIVYLRDVAQVADSFKEEQRIVEADGRRALIVMVQKRSGANTVQVCDAVRAEMDRLVKTLPPDIKLALVMDSSEFIRQAIQNLTNTVMWGGLFVVLTTFVFLRNIRSSLIIILTIPFSLIIAFVFMFLMGWTINIISLSSLAIAIGMVVDNAVVVLENITRHVERGEKVREASMFGSEEVGLAIAASTLTTVVVFLPLVFLTGITSIFFKQLGAVVTVTLLASLFCALMLTPMLCSRLVRPVSQIMTRAGLFHRLAINSERYFKALEQWYSILLGWALRHRATVILVAIAAFMAAVVLVPLIGSEFIPDHDTGDLPITIELPVGTRVETTASICKKVESIARELAGPGAVQHSYWRCGQSEEGVTTAFGQKEGSHVGMVGLKLVPKLQRSKSAKQIGREVAERISDWPQIVKVQASAADMMQSILLGGGKPLSIEILGNDLQATDRVAKQIQQIAMQVPGAKDPTISRDLGRPELTVRVDRQKAASLGLNISNVIDSLRTLYYGKEATKFRKADKEYDIFMRLDQAQRQSVEDILNSEIITPSGRRIRLDSIATVEETLGPVEIERKDQQRIVKVDIDTYGRTLGEITTDIQRRIESEVFLPAGVSINYAGMVKEQRESFRSLGLMLALGILLVYMVMAGQFESLLDPFVVMFSVPFAFTGVAVALALTKTSLSLMSFIGMVMLVGMVVNNAIVLIDYTNILRARGQSMLEAVQNAGRDRLRPVLITTLTTLLGMLPMATSRGEGSEMWRPLGISVIGGLTVSTLVTLVLVPTVYSIFEQAKRRFS
ncbi:MAG: efflux RND transporter permease subunit [Sedimentisphaerales bacterium]|nr:efflux RND transporter permease subunit [Sedimentisphaerales bacterium]